MTTIPNYDPKAYYAARANAFGAVGMDCRERLLEALSTGIDPDTRDEDGGTLLLRAAQANALECIRVLAAAGARINRRSIGQGSGATSLRLRSPLMRETSGTALNFAVSAGRIDVAELLLDLGADPRVPDAQIRTALHRAIVLMDTDSSSAAPAPPGLPAGSAGLLHLFKRLLTYPGVLNLPDDEGCTPLVLALEKAAPARVIEMILEQRPALDVQAKDGSLPIHRFWDRTDLEILRQMVLSGADVKALDRQGRTALFRVQDAAAVHALVDLGCEIDSSDNLGRSALAWRLSRYDDMDGLDVPVLLAMIQRGADIHKADLTGETPDEILTRDQLPFADDLRSAFAATKARQAMLDVAARSAASPHPVS